MEWSIKQSNWFSNLVTSIFDPIGKFRAQNLALWAQILKNRSEPWNYVYFEETNSVEKRSWRAFPIWAKLCDWLSALRFNRCANVSDVEFKSNSCSIKVNFACLLNRWFLVLKCLHAGMWSFACTSLRWLFRRRMNSVSDLPIYWSLQIVHFPIKYIRYSLFQWRLWYISYFVKVTLLWKVDIDTIWLQHRVRLVERQGLHLPDICLLLFYLTLFDVTSFCPMYSLRFLFLLKAIIGLSLNVSARSWLIVSRSKCLYKASFTFRSVRLYVNTRGIRSLSLYLGRSSLAMASAF